MADSGKTLSKSQKKNMKRLQKKQAAAFTSSGRKDDDDGITPQQIKEILTQEMNEARQAKDNEKVNKLREQLWVINDLIRGVKTNMPEEELAKILQDIPLPKVEKKEHAISGEREVKSEKKIEKEQGSGDKMAAKVESQSGAENGVAHDTPAPPEKRLRNLKKKLNQIEKIKEKLAAGENLETSQREKLQAEDKVREEIEELEIEIGLLKLR